MTILLCHDDAYLKEFEATVLEVVGGGVVLDRTAFYPGGGGQPTDTGTYQVWGARVAGQEAVTVRWQAGA